MLAAHQVLLVSEEGIVLFSPAEKGVTRSLSLNWREEDFPDRLSHVCRKHQKQPMVVLFNHADQTYRKEENVTPAECRKTFDEKLPETSFPGRAVLQTAKPANSYLMVAMPAQDRMGMLGHTLSQAHVHVAGCGVLPVESLGLVNALAEKAYGAGKKSRWVALVGQHELGGLRQLVTRDGELALTRLTPLSDDISHGRAWADNVAHEFKATVAYLTRFGYSDADGLDLIAVGGAEEMRLLQAESLPATRMRCMTLAESLKLLGCRSDSNSAFIDELHAAWSEHQQALTLPIPVPGFLHH